MRTILNTQPTFNVNLKTVSFIRYRIFIFIRFTYINFIALYFVFYLYLLLLFIKEDIDIKYGWDVSGYTFIKSFLTSYSFVLI